MICWGVDPSYRSELSLCDDAPRRLASAFIRLWSSSEAFREIPSTFCARRYAQTANSPVLLWPASFSVVSVGRADVTTCSVAVSRYARTFPSTSFC